MKIEKSNNPAAVGALILVLVLIVCRIVWMLLGQNRAADAASAPTASAASPTTTASAASPTTTASAVSPSPVVPVPTATPAPAPARPKTAEVSRAAPATTGTERNPFASPVPVRPSLALLRPVVAWRDQDADRGKGIRVMPLPPMSAWAGKPGGTTGASQVSSLPGLGVPPMPAGRTIPAQSSPRLPDPVQSLKLTAIVDGTAPMAIVQTVQPEPVILHVGDDLEGMRVIAIHDDDMVFARGRGQWTLRLQSAAEAGVPGAVSVSSVTVSEEKTNELQ